MKNLQTGSELTGRSVLIFLQRQCLVLYWNMVQVIYAVLEQVVVVIDDAVDVVLNTAGWSTVQSILL